MALFTDTVTVFQKQRDGSYRKTIVNGCQWSEKYEKTLQTGKLEMVKYVSITFVPPHLVDLETFCDEDAIFYGAIAATPTDTKRERLSDLMKRYPRSGIIRAVNNNLNRDMLKNLKVVLY